MDEDYIKMQLSKSVWPQLSDNYNAIPLRRPQYYHDCMPPDHSYPYPLHSAHLAAQRHCPAKIYSTPTKERLTPLSSPYTTYSRHRTLKSKCSPRVSSYNNNRHRSTGALSAKLTHSSQHNAVFVSWLTAKCGATIHWHCLISDPCPIRRWRCVIRFTLHSRPRAEIFIKVYQATNGTRQQG